MIEIDGGDGGGQIVRSSVALAALLGEPVTVENVRGDRSDPGLKAQHLAAVEAVGAVCDADVDGAESGSETLTFEPGQPTGGEYAVDVGTAGSVTLVFDAVLPLAVALDEPLALTATGGTDVAWSPPMAFYRHVKLPLLRRAGLGATVDRERPGFYPVGDGEATLHLTPSAPAPLSFEAGAPVAGARIYSQASTGLADASVAERQADTAAERLEDADVEVRERRLTYAESASPGSAVTVRLDRGGAAAGFTALGERGKPAEDVGAEAAEEALSFAECPAPVDRHLADQLLLFLALAGGEYLAPAMTDHLSTSLALFDAFGLDVEAEERAEGWLLRSSSGLTRAFYRA